MVEVRVLTQWLHNNPLKIKVAHVWEIIPWIYFRPTRLLEKIMMRFKSALSVLFAAFFTSWSWGKRLTDLGVYIFFLHVSSSFKLRRNQKPCTLSVTVRIQACVFSYEGLPTDSNSANDKATLVEFAYKLFHPLPLFLQTCARHAGYLRPWTHHWQRKKVPAS